MINATEAANAAMEYLKSFYPKAGNVMLEEVEWREEKKGWSVTVSFEDNTQHGKNSPQIIAKVYKIFSIDATGQVKAMKSKDYK